MATLEQRLTEEFKKGPGVPGAPILEDRLRLEFEGRGESVAPSPSQVVKEESLGPPGLENIKARFGISEGRTFGEKLKAFKSAYPEGELVLTNISSESPMAPGQRTVAGERQLLFRRNAKEPFAKVDAGAFEKIEPISDLIDFMGGDVGSALGQIAAMMPANRTISVLPMMGRLFSGATVGDIAQQGVQTLRGAQEEGAQDVAAGGVVKGVGAAAGGGIANVVSKFMNAFKGGGFMALDRGSEEAQKAAGRLGVNPLIAPQLSINPILQKAANQSAATSSTLKQYVDEQGQAAVRALNRVKPAAGDSLENALSVVENQERNMILNRARSLLSANVEGTTAGRRVQQLIDNWDDVAKTNVNNLYQKARTIESPQFDLSPALNVAKTIEQGVQAVGRDGKLIKVSGTSGDPVQAEVSAVVNVMKDMEPSVIDIPLGGGKTVAAVDQLNALRKRLYDAKTPNTGEKPRESHAIAQRLYSAITDVIENPTNKSESFVTAWRQANKAAANRFDTLDKIMVHKAIASETPSALASRLASPGQAENLALLRGLGQPKKYQAVQDHFKSQLLDSPDDIVKMMDSFDKPTLNLLMDKSEQAIFRDVGSKLQKLNSLGIKRALEKQSERGALALEALEGGDTRKIADFARLIDRNGGPSGSVGRSIRAGLMDNIIANVKVYSKAGERIDFNKLNSVIEDYEKKGLTRFLTPSDIAHLKDQRLVAERLKITQDTGSSIQAAEQASQVVFHTSEKALYHMARLMGFGKLMTMPSVNRFLIGRGVEKSARLPMKTIGGILGSVVTDLEQEQE